MTMVATASALRWIAGRINVLATRIELPATTTVITADCVHEERVTDRLFEEMRARVQSRFY